MARASNNNNNTTLKIEENEEFFRDQFEFLLGIFPDANPKYLVEKCKEYYEDTHEFQRFIRKTLKSKQYPRKKDYEKEQELSKLRKFYTTDFNIEEFLKIIPNPEEYFSENNKKRMNIIKHFNNDEKDYAETFLKNHFSLLYCKHIKAAVKESSYDLIKTAEKLKNCDIKLKKKRGKLPMYDDDNISIDLLQEIAYIKNRRNILAYIRYKNLKRQNDVEIAKAANLLNTCECCFDDEILNEETITCEKGHKFCLACTKKGCEVMLEQGKQDFPCLTNCFKYFDVFDLERVLSPKVFSSVCKARQLKEVKAAALDNLECCPHCDFAAIVEPESRVFNCLNPECLKETCRLCRQPAHVPLRCNEVEQPEEIKMRTYIEDKMTDALVRTCYKCNTKFIKEDGCNKMKCPCGALMCYVCKQPVKDYSHFNGQGGDKYDLCPLFSNTNKLHERNVLDEARRLRESTGGVKLKVDPTDHTNSHYKEKSKRKSHCTCRRCNY